MLLTVAVAPYSSLSPNCQVRTVKIVFQNWFMCYRSNMQYIAPFCLVLYLTLVYGAPTMTDIQLEQTLADRSTMQRHLKCALGEGPCDPVGVRLRTLAPLVLRGACPQCSAQETRQIRRTLAFVQRNYPWEWAKIVRQHG